MKMSRHTDEKWVFLSPSGLQVTVYQKELANDLERAFSDAERYQYLKEHCIVKEPDCYNGKHLRFLMPYDHYNDLDAAVDVAIARMKR